MSYSARCTTFIKFDWVKLGDALLDVVYSTY